MPLTGPLLTIAALIYRAQSDLQAYLTDEKDIASHLPNDEPSTENSSLQQEVQRHCVIGFN